MGVWEDVEGYKVTYRNFPFGHGEKSVVMLLCSGLELTDAEMMAIRWHMGMFECGEYGSSTRASYRKAMEKSPLVCLLQMADMLSANCLEATTTW